MNDTSDPKYSKLRQTWQAPEAAAAYRLSRRPECSKRFDREESILGTWLDFWEETGLVLDFPGGPGGCLRIIGGGGLWYMGADIPPAMIAEARDVARHQPHPELVQEFVVADA